MKSASIALFVGIVVCALVLPFATAEAAKFEGNILYSFCSQANCTDGRYPGAGLIGTNGKLYGTTSSGGTSTSCNGLGCGTVFSIDPSTGAETVLYSFCGNNNCTDGAVPVSSLIAVDGILYGTTSAGGAIAGTICASGCGTVFSLDPNSGTEKVLYSFCSQANCTDGAQPVASLINVKSLLYGTTHWGGTAGCNGYGCGTVFSIDPSNSTQKVLYSFCSQANCTDGQWPVASLISAKDMLYGTTKLGGLTGCGEDPGTCGTVFAIDLRTGAEKLLYSFCNQPGCSDGAQPLANLINVKGILYGTTSFGGAYNCQSQPPGCGTVFALDPATDTETVLHSFGSGTDGFIPEVGLIDMKGKLYGTTNSGGSQHAGMVFTLDMSTGAEKAIWSLCGTNCGVPSSLIDVDGKLYGTMMFGGTGTGCGTGGCGAVFVINKQH